MECTTIVKEFIENEFSKEMFEKLSSGGKENDTSEIINYIIEKKAWNDTVIREKYKNESILFKNKKNIWKCFSDYINESKNWTENYKEFHSRIMNELENKGMNVGLAQKFINMSFKYFYFIKIGFGVDLFKNINIEEYKDYFDIPIDSYFLKWFVFNSINGNELNYEALCNWTEIEDSNVYDKLQCEIKELMKEKFPDCNILIAETYVWNEIKKVRKKIAL